MGELRIDDVVAVTSRRDESVHHRVHIATGPDVLAQFRPIMGDSDLLVGVAYVIVGAAYAIAHLSCPAPCERRELIVDLESRQALRRPILVDARYKCGLIAGGRGCVGREKRSDDHHHCEQSECSGS